MRCSELSEKKFTRSEKRQDEKSHLIGGDDHVMIGGDDLHTVNCLYREVLITTVDTVLLQKSRSEMVVQTHLVSP